jgi:hypothetical protein
MKSQTSTALDTPPTLDEVFALIQYWRDHKDEFEGRGIPDTTWLKLFQLEKSGHSASQLRRMFALNAKQYEVKKQQLCEPAATSSDNALSNTSNSPTDDAPPVQQTAQFCEALISPETQSTVPALSAEATQKTRQTKKSITQLKSTNQKPESFLDMSTIIVEYIRPDGHRLKIHTTTGSIHHVMQSFGGEGGCVQ